MPKFAANVSLMFNEHPVADRFSRAKQAGFAAVEYLHPYANPATTVKQWLDDADVEMILLNTLVGNSEKGDCGLAAVPGRESEFREHIEQALEYATTCGASMIHVMAGVVTEGTSRKAAEVKCIENLPDLTTLQLIFLVLYLSMCLYLYLQFTYRISICI